MAHFGNEGVIAHAAVVLDIDNDPGARGILRGEDAIDEILKVIHHLFMAAYEPVGFVGEDLKRGIAVVLLFFDFGHKAEVAKEGIKNLNGCRIHGLWRFLLFFLASTAVRLATTLFFSSVGSGLFRVR